MLLVALRKNGLTSLFKEVRVFKGLRIEHFQGNFTPVSDVW